MYMFDRLLAVMARTCGIPFSFDVCFEHGVWEALYQLVSLPSDADVFQGSPVAACLSTSSVTALMYTAEEASGSIHSLQPNQTGYNPLTLIVSPKASHDSSSSRDLDDALHATLLCPTISGVMCDVMCDRYFPRCFSYVLRVFAGLPHLEEHSSGRPMTRNVKHGPRLNFCVRRRCRA